MGCKAAETTHNINNAFGPGTANECTVMAQEVLQSLEDEECNTAGHRRLTTTD